MYVPSKDIKIYYENNKGRELNFSGADIEELEQALKESMKTFDQENPDEGGSMVGSVLNQGRAQAEEEKPKYNAFGGQGVSLGGGKRPQEEDTSELDAILVA